MSVESSDIREPIVQISLRQEKMGQFLMQLLLRQIYFRELQRAMYRVKHLQQRIRVH